MKIKLAFLLMFLILIAYPVHALEDLFFSGFMFSEQSVVVNDKSFIVTLEWDKRNIMLRSGQAIFFVPRTKCENAYNIKFCFHNTIWDSDEKKEKINLSIYSLSPTIRIIRTIEKSEIVVGEETKIDLFIDNKGPLTAENFSFLDSFPKEVEITSVSFCNRNGTDVYWKGFLRANESIRCEYTIKPIDEIDRLLRAKIEYFDGIKTKEEFSTGIRINANPYFSISTKFNESDNKIAVGENTTFLINISNNHPDENIKAAKVVILLPKGLSFISTERVTIGNETLGQTLNKVNEGIFEWGGELQKNKSKLIAMKIQGILVGSSDIIIKADYQLNEEKRTLEKKDNIEVEHEEPNIQTSFEDGENFDSGQESWFKIYLTNPSSIIKLKNINVKFNTTLADLPDFYAPEIGTTSNQLVLNKRLVMPMVTSTTKYHFGVIVSYQTEFGQFFEKRFEYNLNVEPIPGLTITHSISKTSVEEGEEFTITTNVKNERNSDIKNVKVVDSSHAAFLREGINSAIININAGDNVAVYTYNMTAPEIEKETTFAFKTTASYTEDNATYVYEHESTITVIPKKLDLDIARTINQSPVFMGQIADVSYVITNSESEAIQNIRLKFPLQQAFDLVGNEDYFIDKLEPGESFNLNEKHQIRAKLNETQRLKPTLFTYEDKHGNIFEINSSDNSFEVKSSYIAGPAFYIEKNLTTNATMGEPTTITLKVKNLGTEKGTISVYDNQQIWNFEIEPGNYEIATYKLNFTTPGKIKFRPAVGIYNYLNKTIKTASNELEIDVKEKVLALPEIPVEVVKPEVKINITGNVTELPRAKGIIGFVLRIIDALKGIF